jgi:hypothetical protein
MSVNLEIQHRYAVIAATSLADWGLSATGTSTAHAAPFGAAPESTLLKLQTPELHSADSGSQAAQPTRSKSVCGHA